MINDLRLSVLRLLRRPASSALVVLVMAAGVGLSATVFSTAWGLLWRGLDVDGELVRLAVDDDRDFKSLPWDAYAALRERCRSCDEIGAWLPLAVDVGELDLYPERLNGALVSAGMLEMLGVEPLTGRLFTPEEERTGAPVVVVGERLWRQQLGGSAEALGRQITIYRNPVTVVGVVPEGVRAPFDQELWIPITASTARSSPWMQAVVRLADGATAADVRGELGSALAGLDAVESDGGPGPALVESFEKAYLDEELVRSLRLSLAAVALVFLAACANAASLLMARGLERRRELAVRRALGADRRHLLRLQMMEVSMLALVAGGLGFGLARLGVELFRSMGPIQGPYWMDVRLDGAAVAFVAAVTLLVALAAGLLPAWLGTRLAALRAGRGVTLSQPWLRRLVVAQVALGTAIGAGAWWLLGATDRLGGPLETLRRDDVVVLQSSTFGGEHAASREAGELYWRRVLDELEGLPRVRSAAIAPIPGSRDGRGSLRIGGGEPIAATLRRVSPGALEILELPLLAGRDLRPEELSSRDVVMV
ncbi:MAG: ABC transporter permease, partial [Acidobacteriota bacterium]